jgi:hypothetical protein
MYLSYSTTRGRTDIASHSLKIRLGNPTGSYMDCRLLQIFAQKCEVLNVD